MPKRVYIYILLHHLSHDECCPTNGLVIEEPKRVQTFENNSSKDNGEGVKPGLANQNCPKFV